MPISKHANLIEIWQGLSEDIDLDPIATAWHRRISSPALGGEGGLPKRLTRDTMLRSSIDSPRTICGRCSDLKRTEKALTATRQGGGGGSCWRANDQCLAIKKP